MHDAFRRPGTSVNVFISTGQPPSDIALVTVTVGEQRHGPSERTPRLREPTSSLPLTNAGYGGLVRGFEDK